MVGEVGRNEYASALSDLIDSAVRVRQKFAVPYIW